MGVVNQFVGNGLDDDSLGNSRVAQERMEVDLTDTAVTGRCCLEANRAQAMTVMTAPLDRNHVQAFDIGKVIGPNPRQGFDEPLVAATHASIIPRKLLTYLIL